MNDLDPDSRRAFEGFMTTAVIMLVVVLVVYGLYEVMG